MTTHSEPDLQFEIGHVLFIDIVGYSKLLIDEQRGRIRELKGIVLGTEGTRYWIRWLFRFGRDFA